jgi:hypothetical protein
VLGASRGEAGILGEGVRQALLRDPTYKPAFEAARWSDRASRMSADHASSRIPRAAVADRLADRRRGGQPSRSSAGRPRARLRDRRRADAD